MDKLINQLTSLTGIGDVKAKQLIAAGVKRPSDITKPEYKQLVPESALLHLQFNPQSVEHKIGDRIQKHIGDVGVITGSYIRGRPIINDIDIVCYEQSVGKLVELLKPVIYASGPEKMSAFLRLRGGIYIRLDIFICTAKTYAGTILYTTGSKNFNIRMRAIAKSKGFVLNQRGLFKGDVQIVTRSEKSIFTLLDMEYVKPTDRE